MRGSVLEAKWPNMSSICSTLHPPLLCVDIIHVSLGGENMLKTPLPSGRVVKHYFVLCSLVRGELWYRSMPFAPAGGFFRFTIPILTMVG